MNGEPSHRGTGNRAITAFGIITVVFWLSKAVFPALVFPLVPLPDLSGLVMGVPQWIREQVPGMSRPDAELVAGLRRELIMASAEGWLIIAVGVASGVLVARRSRTGRILAILLCGALLVPFALRQARLAWDHHFVAFWKMFAERSPLHFARMVIDPVFHVWTIVYLMHRPVAVRFSGDE